LDEDATLTSASVFKKSLTLVARSHKRRAAEQRQIGFLNSDSKQALEKIPRAHSRSERSAVE
jgi:hypothetical protein